MLHVSDSTADNETADTERSAIIAAIVTGVAILALIVVAIRVSGRTAFYFTHEAQEVLGGPWYAGAGSTVTALVWWTAATAAGLGALLTSGTVRRGFLAGGVLSAALALDDALRLHDDVYSRLLPERAIDFLYLIAYIAYAWLARELWRRHGWVCLVLAVGLLGLSIFSDVVLQPAVGHEVTLLEDGAKLLGACLWAAAQARFVVTEVRGRSATAASRQS